MSAPLLLAGARTIIQWNSGAFNAAYILDYSIDSPSDHIDTVDIPIEAELAPGRLRVRLVLGIYRTPDNDPGKTGMAPIVDLAGGTYVDRSYTEFEYATIEAQDRVTGQTILFIPKARVDSRQGGGNAESLITEKLTISGIGFQSKSQSLGLLPTLGNLVGL